MKGKKLIVSFLEESNKNEQASFVIRLSYGERSLGQEKNMRTRELTELIGRRDAEAIGIALEENWEDWGRIERPEATATTYVDRVRRIENSLLAVIYGDNVMDICLV